MNSKAKATYACLLLSTELITSLADSDVVLVYNSESRISSSSLSPSLPDELIDEVSRDTTRYLTGDILYWTNYPTAPWTGNTSINLLFLLFILL